MEDKFARALRNTLADVVQHKMLDLLDNANADSAFFHGTTNYIGQVAESHRTATPYAGHP